jgi:hypothetical protein
MSTTKSDRSKLKVNPTLMCRSERRVNTGYMNAMNDVICDQLD